MARLRISESFKKRLDNKTPHQQSQIWKCIHQLREDPRHPGLRSCKVQGIRSGDHGIFESRASRSARVTWEWSSDEDSLIVLRNHCDHSIMDRSP